MIFLPDVRFRVGQPGYSATKCVVTGVKKLIDLGILIPNQLGCTVIPGAVIRLLLSSHKLIFLLQLLQELRFPMICHGPSVNRLI